MNLYGALTITSIHLQTARKLCRTMSSTTCININHKTKKSAGIVKADQPVQCTESRCFHCLHTCVVQFPISPKLLKKKVGYRSIYQPKTLYVTNHQLIIKFRTKKHLLFMHLDPTYLIPPRWLDPPNSPRHIIPERNWPTHTHKQPSDPL